MLSLELCGSCYDLMQRPLEIEGLLEANTKARQMGATGQDRKVDRYPIGGEMRPCD